MQTIITSPENFSARTCLLLFINRSRAFCFASRENDAQRMASIGLLSTGSTSTGIH